MSGEIRDAATPFRRLDKPRAPPPGVAVFRLVFKSEQTVGAGRFLSVRSPVLTRLEPASVSKDEQSILLRDALSAATGARVVRQHPGGGSPGCIVPTHDTMATAAAPTPKPKWSEPDGSRPASTSAATSSSVKSPSGPTTRSPP